MALPWGPDDWEVWPRRTAFDLAACGAPHQAVERILEGLPDPETKRVLVLDGGAAGWLSSVAERFGRIVVLEPSSERLERLRDELEGLPVHVGRGGIEALGDVEGRFDLAIAADAHAAHFPRALRRLGDRLVEGGILLATLRAAPLGPVVQPFGPDAAGHGRLHELEVQYRLRCAGFRGVRIHRFRGGRTRHDELLCMATLRANN